MLTVTGMLLMMSTTAACGDACFVPLTEPPTAERVLSHLNNGQAGRDVMSAVLDGDRAKVDRMLRADPRLVTTGDGRFADLLAAAIGRCDKDMVELLLARGAPPDGPRGETPLDLALRARDLWFAERLLEAGAKPDKAPGANTSPMIEALSLGDWPKVELLLRHGYAINGLDDVGQTALVDAVAMDNFRLAERLLDAGADPWVVGTTGGNAGSGAAAAVALKEPEEDKARLRYGERLRKAGWPWPPPSPLEIRKAVLAGQWPPPGATGKPPPAWVVEKMRALYNPDGSRR